MLWRVPDDIISWETQTQIKTWLSANKYINTNKVIYLTVSASTVSSTITKAAKLAIKHSVPLVLFTSSGGARMQEGIISLMQMPRTVAAVELLSKNKIPYIVVLTDPTTGGVTASFAMLGDITIAEQNSTIGFAGKRVIQDTIREELPLDFQKSEYLKNRGMVDIVVERKELKNTLSVILNHLK